MATSSDAPAGIWIDWGKGPRSADSMILAKVPHLERLGAGEHSKESVIAAALVQIAHARSWPPGERRPCLEVLLERLLEDLEQAPATRCTIERLR